MEKMRDLGPVVFPYYGGYNAELSPNTEKVFTARRSETLNKNPEAELDHYEEIEKYIQNFLPEYRKEAESLAAQAGKMDKETRLSICIPVAGHQEGKNIYESLKNYTYQDADSKIFEIVLFVNHPEADKSGNKIKPDDTLDEIERFKKDFPEMNVKVMYSALPLEKAKIGYIRKILDDSALLRHHERGKNIEDLIIVSNDADNKGVSPEYVDNFIKHFDSNPKVEAMLGQLDWDPESYVKYPLIHIGTRLFQYLDTIIRHESGRMPSSGANFAFRSSIYAGVGGYIEDTDIAEDVALGRAIISARKRDDCVKFAGARASRLYTSSRRVVKSLGEGLVPIEQWEKGFGPFDDEVRKFELGQGQNLAYNNPEVLEKFKIDLEKIVNVTLNVYERGAKRGKDHPFYKRAIGWLGIHYQLDESGEVRITEMDSLINGLKRYEKEGVELRDRKSGKKNTTEGSKEARRTREPF